MSTSDLLLSVPADIDPDETALKGKNTKATLNPR